MLQVAQKLSTVRQRIARWGTTARPIHSEQHKLTGVHRRVAEQVLKGRHTDAEILLPQLTALR